MSNNSKKANAAQPLIPVQYLSASMQKLYFISFGILCQAIKSSNLVIPRESLAESLESCRSWLFFDLAYCIILAQLRLPGLRYGKVAILFQIIFLWIMDWAIFVGMNPSRSFGEGARLYYGPLDSFVLPWPLGILWSSFPALDGGEDLHLLGQHNIHLSPISTAQLNPDGSAFCLASPGSAVFVPVVLTDINPIGLRYSFAPLIPGDRRYSHLESVDLTLKDFRAIERERIKGRRPAFEGRHAVDLDKSVFQTKKQSVVYIRLDRTGTIRLERVLFAPNIDARIIHPYEVTVVPCPRVEFADLGPPGEDVRCSGHGPDQLMVDAYGLPPLSLKWSKSVDGRREYFQVDGIDRGNEYDRHTDRHHNSELDIDRGTVYDRSGTEYMGVPQELRIPLAISLNVVGGHLYILEEVTDVLGNTVRLGYNMASTDRASMMKTRIARSFVVLRRPVVSFKHCSQELPIHLLHGSEETLTISANTSDAFSSAWEVTMRYQPPLNHNYGVVRKAWLSPWERVFVTHGNRQEISVPAIVPGDYTIVKVKGKKCDGDVILPDTCKVVEKPLPTVEVEWKRIYAYSSEVGMSALLNLSGTPPFQVVYNIQRDGEAPSREVSKTFTATIGEISLQPTSSGHYIFTLLRISDANYERIDLHGLSTEQSIVQPTTAEFVSGKAVVGSNKRLLESCETGTVAVEVELTGKGPWTLDVRVGGQGKPRTLRFFKIRTARKTLKIPIPEAVDKRGGTFEIDLVGVEDIRKYKRPVSAPGISVNVKRAKPTVRFDGNEDERVTTVLEQGTARLPLQLTGYPPWRVRYRREEAKHMNLTATLTNATSNLYATQKGRYEIVDVEDSQCPGSVITNGSSYVVNWIPRPSAKLSPHTVMTYEAYNGSYILPPTCQGVIDHVDIDFTGRPPFQTVYKIIQTTTVTGAKLSYNPTVYSTTLRSPFQLQTSHAARVFYEISQIGDSNYPLAAHKNAALSTSERLLFEQQVVIRPTARFETQGRLLYHLHDSFVPSDSPSQIGTILLEGISPFRLQLSIKDMATRQIDSMTVDIPGPRWKINLPSYFFKTVGQHVVNIQSVSDASNCAPAAMVSNSSSMYVDVGATATIVPYDHKEYYCLWDTAKFHIEGTAPWTIGYRIGTRSHTKDIKVSPFSIRLNQLDDFTITSLTQHRVRRAIVPNLHYKVLRLPSATVAYGKTFYQNVNDGDQAEIVFTLIGQPPFTFNYQRSQLGSQRDGRPGKVLETHTVSHVTTNSYTIYASSEGTWEVTYIADAFCHYPPS